MYPIVGEIVMTDRSRNVLILLALWVVGPMLASCSLMQRNIGPPPTAAPAIIEAAPTVTASDESVGEATAPERVAATLPEIAYDMDRLTVEHPEVPYDALFLDRLLVHILSTLDATRQARDAATSPELQSIAAHINTTQQPTIIQLQEWRSDWYGDVPVTVGPGMTMTSLVLDDAEDRFDQRFVELLIIHYDGLITLADDAAEQAERPELQQFASELSTTFQQQLAELEQIHAILDDAAE